MAFNAYNHVIFCYDNSESRLMAVHVKCKVNLEVC